MDTALLDKSYFFRNLTAIGKPSSALPELISDQQAQAYDASRYNFYVQLLKTLMDPESKDIADKVFALESSNRVRQDMIRDSSAKVATALSSLTQTDDKTQQKQLPYDVKRTINDAIIRNPTMNGSVTLAGGNPEAKKEEPSLFSYYLDKLKDPSKQDEVYKEYKNDVMISPEYEKITFTDRLVFITMTFVIRGLSLFVVQWALNSFMVKNFNQALMLYIATYVGLFSLWVMLTNAADGVYLFKLMFYYVSVTPHGYGRIILHVLLQLMMLPIPSIINSNKTKDIPYTFEESRRIYKTIASFTLFMWLFTTLVAVKY